jgi:hypothetical protein
MARACPRYTASSARAAARSLGVRLTRLGVTGRDLAEGMNVEREHRDVTHCDARRTARIALAHLRERRDYYRRLKRYVEGG